MKIADVPGAGLCLVAMAIVGSSVAVSRSILDYPMLTGQAMRYALAAAVLVALLAAAPRAVEQRRPRTGVRPARPSGASVRRHRAPRPRLRGRDLLLLAALALTGLVLFNILLLTALRHADAATVGTVVGAAPLGLALIGPLLRRTRPTVRLVSAAGVVVVGTALVYGGGHAGGVGLLAAFGALAGEILFSLLAAAALPRLGAVRVSAWCCALAVPMLAGAAVATGELGRWRAPTAAQAATLGYLALMLTVGAFLLWFSGLRRLGVERAGMFVGLLPIATLVTAAVQDAALPGPMQAAGVLVVAAGLAVGLVARGYTPVDQEAVSRRLAVSPGYGHDRQDRRIPAARTASAGRKAA